MFTIPKDQRTQAEKDAASIARYEAEKLIRDAATAKKEAACALCQINIEKQLLDGSITERKSRRSYAAPAPKKSKGKREFWETYNECDESGIMKASEKLRENVKNRKFG